MAKQMITTTQAQLVFGVSSMALLTWRKGTVKRAPLPTISKTVGNKERVFFGVQDLKAWAKKHAVPILVDPATFVAVPATKPGPKVAATVASKATKPRKPAVTKA